MSKREVFDLCPNCQGDDVQITGNRAEEGDVVCQDMECLACRRIWTIEYRPVQWFGYDEDGKFDDTPRPLPVDDSKELYHVRNIKWDCDNCSGLPSEVVMTADPEDMEGNPTLLADTLSGNFGWCVLSLEANHVPHELSNDEMKRLLSLPQLDA